MGFNDINLQVSGPQQPASTYKTKVLKGQVPFAVQVTEPNTKYVIKHNFDLGGESVTIPENCVLQFDGGSVRNGFLAGQNTIIVSDLPYSKILVSITMIGTWKENTKLDNDWKLISMYNSFNMFHDTLSPSSLREIDAIYDKLGTKKMWIVFMLEYDGDKFVVPSWYTYYHQIGSITNLYKYLQRNVEWTIDCIKLHKSENIQETEECANAYEVYCKGIIDEIVPLGIKKIFISNEESWRTQSGSVWEDHFMNICDYAHEKGVNVGFSMNDYNNAINTMNIDLLNNVDYLYQNFYPTLSFNDEKTSWSDFGMMQERVYRQIVSAIETLYTRKPTANYGFSECGVLNRTKHLRYPWNTIGNQLGELDESGKEFDFFWKAVLQACEQIGVNEIANWFLDEHFDYIKDSSLAYIKSKIK